MGLGGPNLVKGAVGQTIDAESLGGADMHTVKSGVAHYRAKDDQACLATDPSTVPPDAGACASPVRQGPPRCQAAEELIRNPCPPITACPITWKVCSPVSSTQTEHLEFQPDYAPEFLCVDALA